MTKAKDLTFVNESAESVPAPYRSVVAHGDENTAVPAKTRLSDGRRAFGKSERSTSNIKKHETKLSTPDS